MAYRVVKQLMPAPTSSLDKSGSMWTDPWWASRKRVFPKDVISS